MNATATEAATDLATAWGRCRGCSRPGLAYVRQFDAQAARCGFCGGPLRYSGTDLSDLAARVIAEPIHHHERN